MLFKEDRADVVAAKAQTHLQNLEALRRPGALQILDVVEVEAADGEGLEVLYGGWLGDVQWDISRLMSERGEGREASGLLLQVAEDFEVVDALRHGFTDPEDHGRGGAEAKLVGRAMDADPIGGGTFIGGGLAANLIVQNDCAASDGV